MQHLGSCLGLPGPQGTTGASEGPDLKLGTLDTLVLTWEMKSPV